MVRSWQGAVKLPPNKVMKMETKGCVKSDENSDMARYLTVTPNYALDLARSIGCLPSLSEYSRQWPEYLASV